MTNKWITCIVMVYPDGVLTVISVMMSYHLSIFQSTAWSSRGSVWESQHWWTQERPAAVYSGQACCGTDHILHKSAVSRCQIDIHYGALLRTWGPTWRVLCSVPNRQLYSAVCGHVGWPTRCHKRIHQLVF